MTLIHWYNSPAKPTSVHAYAFIIVLVGVLVLINNSAQGASNWQEVTPLGAKPVQVKGNKSASNYFSLDKKDPLVVKVTGPGLLRVYTRVILPDKKKEAIYGIVTVRDGDKRYLISRTARYSREKIATDNKVRLGQPKSVTFKVPAGEHEYQVNLPGDSKYQVFSRYAFTPKANAIVSSEKPKYVPFLPRKFSEEVRIVVKEEEYIYYRASQSKSVELEVIGPARLRCVSRLEFDHTMRGEKSYRVQVTEESKIVQTSPFKGQISATASYRQASDLVVGKGDTFFLTVPEGRHRYLITTPDMGATILLRFYLPEKALGNEWKPADENGKAELRSSRTNSLKG